MMDQIRMQEHILVGLLNTLLVAFIGIILATLLGLIVGVARLSPNYLIRKTASFYIEFFRNVPLLLQIFFWYFAALKSTANASRCYNDIRDHLS